MDPIWKKLPDDLALKIIGLLDDIDTRLSFKIPPGRLRIDENFEFRSENVYDPLAKILFQFQNKITIIRKNINLSSIRPGPQYVFNMEWEPYDLILRDDQYELGPVECTNHVVVNKKVKVLLRYGPRDMAQFAYRTSY